MASRSCCLPHADQGDADEEGYAPFPFPQETGAEDDHSTDSTTFKIRPWWSFRVGIQRKDSEKETYWKGKEGERRLEKERGKGTRVRAGSGCLDRKSTRLNSSHITRSRMPSSA